MHHASFRGFLTLALVALLSVSGVALAQHAPETAGPADQASPRPLPSAPNPPNTMRLSDGTVVEWAEIERQHADFQASYESTWRLEEYHDEQQFKRTLRHVVTSLMILGGILILLYQRRKAMRKENAKETVSNPAPEENRS